MIVKATAIKTAGLIPAVGYIRMSTDKQEDSPARQRMEIEKLAERLGYWIVAWYEDHGMTGVESVRRKEFQRLLTDARGGDFKAVLVHEQSRFSREKLSKVFGHLFALDEYGVHLVTTKRGEVDINNIMHVMEMALEAHTAHDESRKVAERTVSGKQLRLGRGERFNGMSLFGYDREVLDETGKVVRVVSFREKFLKPRTWKSRLIVTREALAVKTVRFIFESFAAGWSRGRICRELNAKYAPPRSGKWAITQVNNILSNPSYVGDSDLNTRWRTQRKFEFKVCEPTMFRDTHPPIVSRELFNRVQAVLRLTANRPVRRKDERYLLSGIVLCSCCGQPVGGHTSRDRENGRYYRCPKNKLGTRTDCERPLFVQAPLLDRLVLAALNRHYSQDNEKRLVAAIRRQGKTQSTKAGDNERRLATLQDEIRNAKRNLLKISPENIPDAESMLAEMQREAKELSSKVGIETATSTLTPAAEKAVRNAGEYIKQALSGKADQSGLSMALRTLVESITVDRRVGADGRKQTSGVIIFRPTLNQPSVEFSDSDGVCLWATVGSVVQASYPQTLHSSVVAKAAGLSMKKVHNALAIAARRGSIVKVGLAQWKGAKRR